MVLAAQVLAAQVLAAQRLAYQGEEAVAEGEVVEAEVVEKDTVHRSTIPNYPCTIRSSNIVPSGHLLPRQRLMRCRYLAEIGRSSR